MDAVSSSAAPQPDGIDNVINAFLANISHEIRTPINGIVGLASLLRESPLTKEQQKFADMIMDASQSLIGIVNNILDYSRIQAGLTVPIAESFLLCEVIHDSIGPSAVQAYAKGLEFGCELDPRLPATVSGDRRQVQQILTNLVTNALKFTDKGHIILSARLEGTSDKKTTIHFAVRDTGKGIAEDQLERIFERFTQEDDSITRKYGGTGLGLAICRQLAGILGGRVWAERHGEGGSVFHCVLVFDTAGSHFCVPPWPSANKPRVLIVSANTCVNSKILQSYLTHWEIPFRHVNNSLAIASVGAKFDALILGSEIAQGKDRNFFTDAMSVFNQRRVALLADPILLLKRLDSSLTQGVHVVDKPVRPATLLGFLTGQDSPECSPAGSRSSARRSHSLRVLVAEDNEINQVFVRRTLEGCGHLVTIAVNGSDAVAAVHTQRFDLVLMDIQMPEMDGIEATRRIRSDLSPEIARIPVIALSASAAEKEWGECRRVGMNGFISKPVSAPRLQAKINEILGTRSVDPVKPPSPRPDGNPEVAQSLMALGNDRRLFQELIGIVIAQWPRLVGEVETAGARSDWPALAKALHTVKGSINVFATPGFVPAVVNYMDQAREGRQVDVVACVEFLQRELRHLMGMKEFVTRDS